MTAADLIDHARRARHQVRAVALLFAPMWLAMLVLKPRGRRWR